MGPDTFDQSDRRPLPPAEAITETGGEFKPRGATGNDDNAVKPFRTLWPRTRLSVPHVTISLAVRDHLRRLRAE